MKVISFVSSKGGCGKSFIVKKLSEALSLKEKKVLVAELSCGGRYLDILFDMTDSILYDLSDLENDDINSGDCIACVSDNLHLICASLNRKQLDLNKCIRRLIDESREDYDYLLIDLNSDETLDIFKDINTECEYILVSEPKRNYMRNAEALMAVIGDFDRIGVILNRVNPFRIDKGLDLGIDEVLDILHIPLKGVVYDFAGDFDNGLCTSKENKKLSESIFNSIANRLLGENVPVTRYKKDSIVNKLFG